jgi:hypothetical protein
MHFSLKALHSDFFCIIVTWYLQHPGPLLWSMCNTFYQFTHLFAHLNLLQFVQVSMKTEVTWVRDMLRGDDAYEMRVKLIKQVPEEYPYKDDE